MSWFTWLGKAEYKMFEGVNWGKVIIAVAISVVVMTLGIMILLEVYFK